MPGTCERGAAAMTAVILWFSACSAGLVVVGTVADVAVAAARSQHAADAAALAAAGATPLGPAPASPRGAARLAAALHGARLVGCCGATEVIPPHVEVVVAVAPRTTLARLLRGELVRRSAASLRPGKTAVQPSGFAPSVPNSEGNGAAPRSRR